MTANRALAQQGERMGEEREFRLVCPKCGGNATERVMLFGWQEVDTWHGEGKDDCLPHKVWPPELDGGSEAGIEPTGDLYRCANYPQCDWTGESEEMSEVLPTPGAGA